MARQKVALVTGASSGIGFATAIEFAKRGYKTYACARRLEPMLPLKENGVIIVTCDVTLTESVTSLRDQISSENDGFLDVLFNNAGQLCSFPALDVTDENVAQCFQVNVFAPIRLTREFAALLIKAKGTVGFTGSVAGYVPFPFSSIYSATKSAIHLYAATLRLEFQPFGVKVLNFVTGGVKTNIADTRDLPEDSWFRVPGIEEAFIERREMAKRNNPMPVEKYALQVVNDFEHQSLGGKLNLYRGKMAFFLAHWLMWCPRFVVEWALIRKFKLTNVFTLISEKFSKEKIA
ncbi:1-acylglycerone phosphate reductase [Metschnikowia aff. pulcherrima]|uniref:1-acylglycerone phosphate reductase n=1 Tax=Metschnikowia aff. pulcherrima TaxID=2163413 RepID=A0A4P6XEH3_9ASCO|nr:1-acylglycerone phosphate reductase [Metschnikowia aff. pulcherrima]